MVTGKAPRPIGGATLFKNGEVSQSEADQQQ